MRGRLPRCTLGEPETHELWHRIAALRIPLCIHDKVEELVRLPAMLERFPEITVALDHGWGHKVGEPPYDLLNPLFDLARFPNVRVKTAINNIEATRGKISTPRIFYTKLVKDGLALAAVAACHSDPGSLFFLTRSPASWASFRTHRAPPG